MEFNNGDGKAYAVHWPPAGRFLYSEGVDTNHIAIAVDEWTTAIAWVDRSIGLQQVDAIYCSSGRDYASRNCQTVADPAHEGITKCEYFVSYTYASFLQGNGMETIVALYTNERKIGF